MDFLLPLNCSRRGRNLLDERRRRGAKRALSEAKDRPCESQCLNSPLSPLYDQWARLCGWVENARTTQGLGMNPRRSVHAVTNVCTLETKSLEHLKSFSKIHFLNYYLESHLYKNCFLYLFTLQHFFSSSIIGQRKIRNKKQLYLEDHLDKLLEDSFFNKIFVPTIQEGYGESLGDVLTLRTGFCWSSFFQLIACMTVLRERFFSQSGGVGLRYID